MEDPNINTGPSKWLLTRPVLTGLLVFLALLLMSAYITLMSYEISEKNEQKALAKIIKVIDQNIQRSLDNCQLAALSIALTINNKGEPENFEQVAEEVVKSYSSVDAVQLVPDGIIKYVYPFEENKTVLYYNILKDSARNKEAFKAIEQKKMFFAGPFELRQGGTGIVGRLPVFIDNQFWGFSAVVIKLSSLLKNAGIDTSSEGGYLFQFSKTNPDTKETEYFVPQPKDVSFENAETVFYPDGEWILHGVPTGERKSNYSVFALAGLGILFSLISAFFVTSFMRKPAELQKLVEEQSKELIKSGLKSQAIMQALPDMLFIMNKEGKFVYHYNPTRMDTLQPPEVFLGKNVNEIMPPLLSKEIFENIQQAIHDSTVVQHNYQLEGVDGSHHFEARYVKISNDEVLIMIRETTSQKKAEEEVLIMNQELRNLSDHLQNVREEERASLSRELHDELGQQLTAISLDLHWLKKMSGYSDENILHKINDAISIVQQSSETVKRINTELRPAILDDLGLFAAIEWQMNDFSQRHDIKISYQCDCEQLMVSASRSIAIFRMVQESLNNIAKHANAKHVNLHGYTEAGNLKLIIEDDGIGFNQNDLSKDISFGLLGMKERTHMLNGQLNIHSHTGKGTRIEISIPLTHLNEELNYKTYS